MKFNATMREVRDLMLATEEEGLTREQAFEKVWGDMAPPAGQQIELTIIDACPDLIEALRRNRG